MEYKDPVPERCSFSRENPDIVPVELNKTDDILETEHSVVFESDSDGVNLIEKPQDIEIEQNLINDPNSDIRVVNLSSFVSSDFLLGEKEEDKRYKEAYKKYQMQGEDGNYFVLTPRQRDEIEKRIPIISEAIVKEVPTEKIESVVIEWGVNSTISSILSKGLVLESIKYSSYISKIVADHLSRKDSAISKICELCVGSGITSSHLYIESKERTPERVVQIHAVDNSVESIATSVALFETQNIPYMLLKNSKDLRNVPEKFNGVVLIIQDAIEFLQSNDIQYDAYVSENGISYFDYQKHKLAIDNIINRSEKGTMLAIASLNPKLLVSLDKLFLVGQILSGGKKYLQYKDRAANGDGVYSVNNGKIVKALTPEAGGQIDLLNYLLKNNFKTFLSYMKGLMKATKAAEVLVDEIKSPIPVTEEIIGKYNLSNTSKDWNIPGAPCDVLITKV